jgi:hypothetical protein
MPNKANGCDTTSGEKDRISVVELDTPLNSEVAELNNALRELAEGSTYSQVVVRYSRRWETMFPTSVVEQMVEAVGHAGLRTFQTKESLVSTGQQIFNINISIINNYNHSEVDMSDSRNYSTNVNGGGNNVSGGRGNMSEIRDVTTTINNLQKLPFSDDQLRAAFVAALNDIRSSEIAGVFKDEAVRACEKLAEEASKTKPDKTILEHFIQAIPAAAKAIGSVVTLVKLISGL